MEQERREKCLVKKVGRSRLKIELKKFSGQPEWKQGSSGYQQNPKLARSMCFSCLLSQMCAEVFSFSQDCFFHCFAPYFKDTGDIGF